MPQGHWASLFSYSHVPTEEVDAQLSGDDLDVQKACHDELTPRQAYCLYLSHSLSMWNSRAYEYSVIVFIQTAFPGNLQASSINGIAETVCVLLFSSALGRWVDQSSRLPTLLRTITVNRIAILIACLNWFLILSVKNTTSKHVVFAFALLLGMVEKLSRITNILSIERDWIPVLANPNPEGTRLIPFDLTHLNTSMRRIDLLCKLIAPLAISALMAVSNSEKLATAVVASISTLSWWFECWGVRQVWNENSRLRAPKENVGDSSKSSATSAILQPGYDSDDQNGLAGKSWKLVQELFISLGRTVSVYIDGLRYYFSTLVWIPSVCAAVPHASVLTFSGTLITYLLNAGFSLNTVTFARFIGALFEISSTFFFAWGVRKFSRPVEDDEDFKLMAEEVHPMSHVGADSHEVDLSCVPNSAEPGVIRVGLWGLVTLFLSLIPAVIALFHLASHASKETSPQYSMTAFVLCLSLSFSLLGRWTYDLSATQLTQTLVPPSHRSSFGGTEMSIVSILSLGHWVAAAIWYKQDDFRWLALGSFVLVGIALGAYFKWYKRRESENGGLENSSPNGGGQI